MTSGAIAHRSYSDGNLVRCLACDKSGVEDLSEVRYLVRYLVSSGALSGMFLVVVLKPAPTRVR